MSLNFAIGCHAIYLIHTLLAAIGVNLGDVYLFINLLVGNVLIFFVMIFTSSISRSGADHGGLCFTG